MRSAVRERLITSLKRLSRRAADEPAGSRDWEWSTSASVDAALGSGAGAWLTGGGAFGWTSDEAGFREHVAELRRASAEGTPLALDDAVLDLIVDVALGSRRFARYGRCAVSPPSSRGTTRG